MCETSQRTSPRLLRTMVLAVVVATLVGGLLSLIPTPAQAGRAVDAYSRPSSGVFRLDGLGYGHGIGMSQFGAEGMGQLGKGYRQIVKFYYPGTRLAKVSADRQIKVGLSGILRSTPQGAGVVVPARADLILSHKGSRVSLPARAGGRSVSEFRVVRGRAGLAVWAVSSTKAVKVAGGLAGSVSWRTSEAIAKSKVGVQASTGNKRTYRGFVDVVAGSSSVYVVNRLLLEDYLRSVVSSEVPSSWTGAALRAQAVAARSYALLAQVNARAANRVYDICDTTSCQVYSPISGESSAEVSAVRATAHQYLRDAGQPVFAMFSSANGGYSVAGSRPYLVAKKDPYDGVVTGSANWGHKWSTSVSASKIEDAWPQIGTLKTLKVLGRDGNGPWGGRVLSVGLVGSRGKVSVSADSFRWAAGLKSTWWTVTNADSTALAPAKKVRVERGDRSARVRWSAPATERHVKAYRITVSSTDQAHRVSADTRRLRVRGLTNGRQYRARVTPVYRSGPGPGTATPAFVPSSSDSYFQQLSARRIVERGATPAATREGEVSVSVVGKGRAPAQGTRAVSVRVTAVSAREAGRVKVWPCGLSDRTQVAVTYQADRSSGGLATVRVPANGRLCFGSTTKLSELRVDLIGYYTFSGVGTKVLRSVAARRLVDSRTGFGWSDGRLVAGQTRTVRIAGREEVPSDARTVLVSIGLVRPTRTATLSVAPSGTPRTLGAVVRAPARSWRTGTMVVRLDSEGRLPLRLTRGKSDVHVEVLGWFRPQEGDRAGRFRTVKGFTALQRGASGILAAGESRAVLVRGAGTPVPGAASSVMVQALARGEGSSSGYLTVLPAGSSKTPRPLLAFDASGTQRTLMVVPVGDDGKITVTAKRGPADVSFRVVGWYS